MIQLMPVLADLVLSNENTVKDHLRLIFIDISDSFENEEAEGELLDKNVGDSSGGEFC